MSVPDKGLNRTHDPMLYAYYVNKITTTNYYGPEPYPTMQRESDIKTPVNIGV